MSTGQTVPIPDSEDDQTANGGETHQTANGEYITEEDRIVIRLLQRLTEMGITSSNVSQPRPITQPVTQHSTQQTAPPPSQHDLTDNQANT